VQPSPHDPVTSPGDTQAAPTVALPPEPESGSGAVDDARAEATGPPPRSRPPGRRRARRIGPSALSHLLVVALLVLALGAAAVLTVIWGDDAERGAASPTATPSATRSTSDPADQRRQAVEALLAARSTAVLTKDKPAFLAMIDPTAVEFRRRQAALFDRLVQVPFSQWSYRLAGTAPGLPADRAIQLPKSSTIERVQLLYRFEGNDSTVERDQYLTVVPRGGRWMLAGDDDAESTGVHTERDIWDLGPIRVVRGKSSIVLGDASRAQLTRLAGEADRGVSDVGRVWQRPWSRRPVVVYPSSQDDMAALIGSDGKGLSQIAAVTTGSFDSGLSRGDRVVVNPSAWRTLGALGRRVVLAHELTHLATRAVTVEPVPIWLSEGFADYVAYSAVKVPTGVVASDLISDLRKKRGPTTLPENRDFDAAHGDIAAAYESSWLACRMIAERYGGGRLISLYLALADDKPAPPEGDIKARLGITEQTLVRQWRAYLAARAKA
jgi:hypothetical protein